MTTAEAKLCFSALNASTSAEHRLPSEPEPEPGLPETLQTEFQTEFQAETELQTAGYQKQRRNAAALPLHLLRPSATAFARPVRLACRGLGADQFKGRQDVGQKVWGRELHCLPRVPHVPHGT
jgi:hypothetical protein